MLAYFPQLDSLNAIGVNVKLRRSLDRAEKILAQLRQLAVINAKTTYMETAWGSRLGSPPAKDKQAMLDIVDGQLSALKVSDAERKEIARPFVEFIGIDLHNIYFRVFERLLMLKQQELTRRFPTGFIVRHTAANFHPRERCSTPSSS